MQNEKNVPAPSSKSPGGVTDALAAWEAETGSAAPSGGLPAIRIDANERLMVPFTTSMQRVDIHYLDYPAFQGYVRCPGTGCLLCRIGRQREQRDLIPVYDPVDKVVAVLAISPNIRSNALRPQLAPALRQIQAGRRVLVAVRKPDRQRFAVTIHPLPEDADDGADRIAQFLEEFDAGRVELAGVYPQPAVEELTSIPEIALLMKIKGVSA